MSRRFLAILAVALGCGLALGAGQASANHVSCGDEITADTTLDSDLVNCENNGIVIDADDITLDLNGHRIDGDGTEFPGCDPKTELCDFGIANDGHDGVTVRDGSVREFGIGVLVGGARENRVLNITSSSHDVFGAVVGGSSRSVIRGGSFSRNIAPEGDGIGLFGSDHIRIVRNKIRRNPGPGIHVFDSTANLIKGNRFARNGPGLPIEADRNRVRRNRFSRDEGIIVLGSRNVVARNRLTRGGIAVENGRGNLVARNVVRSRARNRHHARPRTSSHWRGRQRRPRQSGQGSRPRWVQCCREGRPQPAHTQHGHRCPRRRLRRQQPLGHADAQPSCAQRRSWYRRGGRSDRWRRKQGAWQRQRGAMHEHRL